MYFLVENVRVFLASAVKITVPKKLFVLQYKKVENKSRDKDIISRRCAVFKKI